MSSKTHQIKVSAYIRRIILHLVILCLLCAAFVLYPFHSIFFPEVIADYTTITNDYNIKKNPYVNIYTSNLYYTGFDNKKAGKVTGHYYYALRDHSCMLFLIDADSTKPQPVLKAYQKKYKLIKNDDVINKLTSSLASSVQWSETSLQDITVNFIASETDYPGTATLILSILLSITALLSIINLLICFIRLFSYKSNTRRSF